MRTQLDGVILGKYQQNDEQPIKKHSPRGSRLSLESLISFIFPVQIRAVDFVKMLRTKCDGCSKFVKRANKILQSTDYRLPHTVGQCGPKLRRDFAAPSGGIREEMRACLEVEWNPGCIFFFFFFFVLHSAFFYFY